MNENLFSRRFWRGHADARVLALYRLLLGAVLVYDALDRLRDFHTFYTERGILPRAVAFASRGAYSWSLFDMIQPWRLQLAVYLLAVAVFVLFALGYRTRVTAVLSWVFLVSIQHRNDLVLDGSDVVLRVMLFWMLFADSGACWSLDVRQRRRAARALVPAPALGFLRVQFALVYLFTAVDKWHGGWWSGNYLYQVMQSYDFVRWAGPWLLHFPRLCQAMTRGVLIIEVLIPLLLLSPIAVAPCRALGLSLNLGLHAGIFATLAVGNFPGTMITASSIFLLPDWLDRLSSRPASVEIAPRGRWALWLGGPLVALIIGSVTAFSFRLPFASWLSDHLELLGLRQAWPMFARGLPYQGRWLAPGRLTDGREVEVFSEVAPGLLTARAGARYSRWYKLRFGLAYQKDYTVFDSVGRYLCRRYNGRASGPQLRELEIQFFSEQVPGPGESAPPAQRLDMYRTRCIETDRPEQKSIHNHSPFTSPPRP